MDDFEQQHPRGQAGRFTETVKVDPGTTAIGADWRTTTAVRTLDEQDEDGLYSCTQDTIRGDAELQRRCRRILGVVDDSLPVTVVHSESESNPWGCDTWESDENVTIACGGRTLVAADLPELFRRLDAADLPRMTDTMALDLWHRRATVTVLLANGWRVTGRVTNWLGTKVLLDDGTPSGRRLDFTQIIGFEEQS